MDGFKNSKTLLEEQREKGMIRNWERPLPEAAQSKLRQIERKRPTENLGEVCEQWIPGGCKAMLEAVSLGLTKQTVTCTGIVTTICGIRSRLAAGTTVKGLFNK